MSAVAGGLWENVAEQLYQRADHAEVAITDGGVEVYVPSWLPWVRESADRPTLTKASATTALLSDTFGRERIERIAERYGMDISSQLDGRAAWTRLQIKRLFVGVADIRSEDIQEYLAAHDDDELSSMDDYFRIRKLLVPFERMETIFLNNVPVIRGPGKAPNGGIGFQADRERVLLIEQADQFRKVFPEWRHEAETSYGTTGAETADLMKDYYFKVRYLKRIIDREPPVGTIVPTAQGYYVVHDVLTSGRGLSAPLLKPLAGENLPPIISCQGTRSHPGATDGISTWVEDLHPELGSEGWTLEAQDKLHEYLDDPEKGFVSHVDEKVEVWGMSLGGVHAQRITIEIADRVQQLVTLCSPFLEVERTEDLADLGEHHLRTQVIVTHGDVVDFVMDRHLGHALLEQGQFVEFVCMEKVDGDGEPGSEAAFLHSVEASLEPTEAREAFLARRPTQVDGPLAAGLRYLAALKAYHCEETTLHPYRFTRIASDEIENQALLRSLLSNAEDPERSLWEIYRSSVSGLRRVLEAGRDGWRFFVPFKPAHGR